MSAVPARPGMIAEFLDGPAGRLFAIRHEPPAARARLLLLHPLAEEMNRARPTLAALARALAARGIATVAADLRGTGDSDGEFGEASWSGWLADIAALRARFADGALPLRLGGLRAGALLAAQSLAGNPRGISGLDLLQPPRAGDALLRQLLRTRIAAAMARGARERSGDLMARLEAGESLDLGGYSVAPGLASGLAAARLDAAPPPAGARVRWIEIAAQAASGNEIAARLPDSWDKGAVRCHGVAGPAFWSLAEEPVAPDLVERLAELLAEPAP